MRPAPWIGVDLDGTLAYYTSKQGIASVGPPIPAMVARVKRWLAQGLDVKIVTARVHPGWDDWRDQVLMIQDWCAEHIGERLDVTCMKDLAMLEIWDDRAVRVDKNTGVRLSPSAYDEGDEP